MRLSLAIEGFLLHRAGVGSMATVRDYRNTLHKWVACIDDVDTSELNGDTVRRFLYHLRIEEELSPKTVKNAWIGLSSFFTWLEGEMGIEHVIRRYKIKMPAAGSREIIPLSKNDVKVLLMACERTAVWKSTKRAPATMQRSTRVRDRAIVLVLLDTGIRVSEMCNLLTRDVDMKSGAIQVRRGKLDKGRTVYVGNVARDALWCYVSKRKNSRADDPVFETTRGQAMDRSAVRKLLLTAGQRAEIVESVTPHRLRHTIAITYLRNGGDVYTLQRLLGHSSMEMVRRYLALAQTDVADAHRRASPADNWRLG
jgi:site-specific recombinase XerD